MLGLFLLSFLSPVLTQFAGKPLWVQVIIVLIALPVVLVAGLCLASAARPGSLGRAVRRARARRRG